MSVMAVTITEREKAELVPLPDAQVDPGPGEVAGRTLTSLISPGTEINSAYLGERFPSTPGYAAVFEVEQIGDGVESVSPGDHHFCMGRHQSWQVSPNEQTVPVPGRLAPEIAVVARLMAVSMATLRTTTARPGDVVLVTGLGPVGHLASQIFRAAGYRVTGVDPESSRRAVAERAGIPRVLAAIPEDDPTISGQVALQLECSGSEAAALDGCRVIKKRGEIVQVGTPWSQKTDRSAYELMRSIFFNYAVLRSGWEWELPVVPTDFRPGSIVQNFETALEWLSDGRVSIEGVFGTANPNEAQETYQDLMHKRTEYLSYVFDWAG